MFRLHAAARLGVAVSAAAVLGASGCSNSSSSSSSSPTASSTSATATSSSPAAGASATTTASSSAFSVKQIVLATTLKHSFQPNGKGAMKTESLSQPDDIVSLGGNLFVGFQNGVGSQGEVSTSGNP